MSLIKQLLFLVIICMFCYCKNENSSKQTDILNNVMRLKETTISKTEFGKLPNNAVVEQYTLTNANGLEMKVITYGGIITSLKVPDKDGNFDDIVLGYDNLQGYLNKNPYFGAIIGRYANRIANGKFTLEGKVYTLATNNGNNHLHGGQKGFDKVLWQAETVKKNNGVGIQLRYDSVSGEEGYPGNLKTEVNYFLDNDNTLTFDFRATTDESTIVNLCQHTYFNLNGGRGNILNHELMLHADSITPINEDLIPTGELMPVTETPFDFTMPKAIGRDINEDHRQLKLGRGYDHNWVIKGERGDMNLVATCYEPFSGRLLEVYTTEPGIQLYTGNFLDGTITGKDQIVYNRNYGFCLETQHFPDSPNQLQFPSTVIKPSEVYSSTTKIRFLTK